MAVVRPPPQIVEEPGVITEVTRRNIVDAISATGLGWAGRLDEDVFLDRIYELDKMPSQDHRYKTARGDIQQHRVNFQDGEATWVFDDERFELKFGPDALFARFLAETLHPMVRPDAKESESLLAIYNEHLGKDGWVLAPMTTISGRPVFEGRRITAQQVSPTSGTASLTEFLPSELIGRFQILHELGTGSFGTVYQVLDVESLQRFALKISRNNPEARERARREQDAGMRLAHPNILEIIEHHADAHWFLQHLAEGTLGQLCFWGRVGPQNADEVATAVGEALIYAHEANFLHRDLHPENILRHDGIWRVADWGLAKARDHQRLTRTRSVGGATTWTAPEQLRSLKDADVRSDLFSLGRLVEWLASGKVPNPAVPGKLEEGNPLGEFVAATTKLEREQRPPTVRAALELLQRRTSLAKAFIAPAVATGASASLSEGMRIESQEVSIELDYKKVRITQEHHDYELVVVLVNGSRRRLDDWELEIEFPTLLLGPTNYGIKVEERSNADVTLFRVEGRKINKPLRPADRQTVKIGYFVNRDIYRERQDVLSGTVKARSLVDGLIVAEVERPLSGLENF